MPLQHPNTGKTSRFGGFGPFSEFSVFSVFSVPFFSFFPFFPFFFSVFRVFFRFFRFLGGRVSEETVPQHSVCVCVFSYPSFPPKLKATHPKRPNAQWKMQPCKLIVAVGSPQALHQCRRKCVVCQHGGHRTQRPKDGGAESNTACRTGMDGHKRVLIWYAHTNQIDLAGV